MSLDRPSQQRAPTELPEVRVRHRKMLALLKRVCLSARVESLGGGRFLAQYDELVDCVCAHFEAKERVLRLHSHPAYGDTRSAHLGIVDGLAETRDALRRCPPIALSDFLHCLDALVVHLTIHGAAFRQSEPRRTWNRPFEVRDSSQTPYPNRAGPELAFRTQERL